MTRRLRGRWLALGLGLVGTLAAGTADAADKTKVDRATQQVQKGAHQLGQGKVGDGVKETAKGICNTVVEGAKFSGETIKEFFSGKK
jgi:hypothetical protein